LPELWRREFHGRAGMPILRLAAGDRCLSVVLGNDVPWQQALSSLWDGGRDPRN